MSSYGYMLMLRLPQAGAGYSRLAMDALGTRIETPLPATIDPVILCYNPPR